MIQTGRYAVELLEFVASAVLALWAVRYLLAPVAWVVAMVLVGIARSLHSLTER